MPAAARAEIEIPAGPLTHDFALARWATISGTVVHVLTKQPVPGVFAFAGGGTGSSRNIGSILAGRAPTTDQAGKFVVPRVAAGKGELHIMGKDGFAQAAKRRAARRSSGNRGPRARAVMASARGVGHRNKPGVAARARAACHRRGARGRRGS